MMVGRGDQHIRLHHLLFFQDPAGVHLPDVGTIDGILDLLSVCILVMMGNVLDFRTYRAPSQKEEGQPKKNESMLLESYDWNAIPLNERQAICYSRGIALHIMDWIRTCCTIESPGDEVLEDLPSRYLVQIANSLLNYKHRAENQMLSGSPGATLVQKQIHNVMKLNANLRAMWKNRASLPSDSLHFHLQEGSYKIQWNISRQTEWRSLQRGTQFPKRFELNLCNPFQTF